MDGFIESVPEFFWINICCAETLDELISIDRKAVILVNVEFGDVSELTDHIIIEQK